MKYFLKNFLLILIIVVSIGSIVFSSSSSAVSLTSEEQQWLAKNKNRVLTLGIDPYSGSEYFKYNAAEKGYLIPLIKIINKDLGINIRLEASKTWGEVYSGLQNGSVDILFGANKTPERDKLMVFTKPLSKSPYALIAREGGDIHTIGDIDKRAIGFLKNDIVMELLPQLYKNIKYAPKTYNSEIDLISALKNNEIDAFITSGGDAVYDYIYEFPELKYVFKLDKISSDRTLSTRKVDKILASILDKEVNELLVRSLPKLMMESGIEYNIKIMKLTQSETDWLKNNGTATIGITKDYLPFDYYKDGIYGGISGEITKDISAKTGIKFNYVYDDFDILEQKLVKGEINVLNIARTDDRLKHIIYPRPYSTERDIIMGKIGIKDASDVFGLEGKKVAVIKGFWHNEYLRKNLTSVNIIETNNIQESLKLLQEGKVEYIIENPSVLRFYIENMQLYDIVQKGTTSTDSYLYYGISKNTPELASIIDKVIPLMDMDELFNAGYAEVPHETSNQKYKYLIFAILGLAALIFLIILFVIKLFKDLISEKTKTSLLREKEHLLYTDALTNVYNRNYYNDKVKDKLDTCKYPQTIIVSDVNNLKTVNDKYGHIIGDELLKCFADTLRQAFSECNLILRMGGDEFLLILESINEEEVDRYILKVKRIISEKSLIVNINKSIKISAAFGYAIRHCSEENIDTIIALADKRMYEDKKKIKNEK
ncbi:transporter substrate-binding domain-containing protein [Clostridium bowmanii]|uniref:transporter substrate-binding domain-containing diguanylate cyclase n=1 Tax=Clostridium bowmanii TaxID=132925 RepID=UPI001C0C226B|nr:transporter substrate-binding domain-containing protein [Clostridium bowmanii]MBU3188949.1 transporter substrate-binding domain-containing protein [Clostridium bowmanii]MCA1073642.1 transporter substrate-binding domain-containing protein [Clostridium bowmanii]